MNDSYHTLGATKDRAQTAAREQVRNAQLGRIADALEKLVEIQLETPVEERAEKQS